MKEKLNLVISFLSLYIKYIKFFIVLLSLSAVIVFFYPNLYKDFGKYAWFLLIFVMFIRPLRDIFNKCKIINFLNKFRREAAILLSVLVLAHVVGAFTILNGYGTSFYNFWKMPETYKFTNYWIWGIISTIVMIPLFITSNSLATKVLGKKWKLLQKLSYIMFITAGLHIYFIKKEIGPIVILVLWGILFFIAYKKNKQKETLSTGGKRRICIPCGYIYDESIGDEDGGILPGTKFEDIPDNRRCPICGVGKDNFMLLDLEEYKNIVKILSIIFLTSNVIEVELETEKELDIKPGQFMKFMFEDKEGKFERSYSIAEQNGNKIKFLIKALESGRGSNLWINKIKKGDQLELLGPYGDFILQNTKNPKVFIATGTGSSPIYNMLLNTEENIKKYLYFGVQKLDDIFYEDKLKQIPNLELNIFLSKEQVDGYNYGRIKIEKYFPENTEFYICGNPSMVESMKKELEEKGYKNIYNEKFL